MAIFKIDCTLPPHGTTFVQPPNARGTLDIVYSCLAVIVLCTWSVLHLNVPVQIAPAKFHQKLVRGLNRTLVKMGWMAFNILAPEWPFAQAVSGLINERQLQKTFDRYTEDDKVTWTGSHTQLASMGGLVIRFDRALQSSMHQDDVVERIEDTRCIYDECCCNRFKTDSTQSDSTLMGHYHSDANLQHESDIPKHLMSANLRGHLHEICKNSLSCPHAIRTCRWSGNLAWKPDPVNIAAARVAFADHIKQQIGSGTFANISYSDEREWLSNLRALCGDRWYVDADQLALARRLGIIDKLPCMSEDEIGDLNKGDIFVKFLAVSQISWLCIQLITRVSRGLATTQLEIVTLAFAVISIITYILLYNRPKDVQTVRELYANRYPTPDELSDIATTGPSSLFMTRRDVSIPNGSNYRTSGAFPFSVSIVLVAFGGLHLLAWNYEFPTQIERVLWQASAITTVAAAPLMGMIDLVDTHFGTDTFIENFYVFYVLAAILLGVAFVAARGFVLVEIVRSLAYQPPGTFQTTWAANVPHA